MASLFLASCHLAWAADAWPRRTITIVVPFEPGGITDLQTRSFAKRLGERLGQAVIIDNRAGAGGSIGTTFVARQAPDGYTLLAGTPGTMGANLVLYKNLPYQPLRDFVGVHGLVRVPGLMLRNPSTPFKTVQELVAYAKANPKKVTYGSAGAGTTTHLYAELFQKAFDIQLTHIPYKGGASAMQALIAGTIDVLFDYAITGEPLIKAGRVQPLMLTTGEQKLASMPSVPTIGGLGHPEAAGESWIVLMAPAKTPPDVVRRLADEVDAVARDPEVIADIEKIGALPMTDLKSTKLDEFMRSEVTKWVDAAKRSGASVD